MVPPQRPPRHLQSHYLQKCRHMNIQHVVKLHSTLPEFALSKPISVMITPPEASPKLSSQLRRSRGRMRVPSGPEPIRLVYVKQSPSGLQSLCSPGCPLRLPELLDDAYEMKD